LIVYMSSPFSLDRADSGVDSREGGTIDAALAVATLLVAMTRVVTIATHALLTREPLATCMIQRHSLGSDTFTS